MNPFFKFTDQQKAELFQALEKVEGNPYKQYGAFHQSVRSMVANGDVPQFFLNVCDEIKKDRSVKRHYTHLLRNCPIDSEVPMMDQDDPLNDKYRKKNTSIAEAFLELYAQLTGTPPLAYETRNNGDFFHDVYANNRYSNTQTQKTDGELFYHNDRTAHPIRADYLNLLGMRCAVENRIYTGYVDGRDLLKIIAPEYQEVLRQANFVTPYDEYSRDSNNSQWMSDKHIILQDEHSFRYYETRTTVAPDAPVIARDALLALRDAILKAPKGRVHLNTGDLFSFPNQDGLHNRELIEIQDPAEARRRWLLKTYNFRDEAAMNLHSDCYREGRPGLVREVA